MKDHARFEEVLVAAICSRDPEAAMRRAARDRRLSPELRARFAITHSDGIRMAALLVARLRFERLLHGSPLAAEAWELRPEKFTALFRRYHHEAPPSAFFPAAEAKLFAAWCRRRKVAP